MLRARLLHAAVIVSPMRILGLLESRRQGAFRDSAGRLAEMGERTSSVSDRMCLCGCFLVEGSNVIARVESDELGRASQGTRHVGGVPRLSEFYGIVIYMYFGDHNPPHFHAIYAEHEALVRIDDGSLLGGQLPRTAARLVEQWRFRRCSAGIPRSGRRRRGVPIRFGRSCGRNTVVANRCRS